MKIILTITNAKSGKEEKIEREGKLLTVISQYVSERGGEIKDFKATFTENGELYKVSGKVDLSSVIFNGKNLESCQ